MVAVDVGNEYRPQTGDVVACPAEARKGCGRSIDDVVAIKKRKGVMSPVGQKGVARSQHLDAVGHVAGTARCFLFSSVDAVGTKDVKRYQR